MGESESPTRVVVEARPPRAPLPVTHSIVKPGSVLDAVTGQYAIEAPVECSLLQPALNDSYLVTTQGSRYVARLYGAHRRRLEIAYELELLLHLGAGGVSVAGPVATADGSLTSVLEAPEGPRELALFRFADGAPISWRSEQHCRLAGRLAAAIHGATDGFISEHPRPRLDLEQLVDVPLRAVEPFLVHRSDDWAFLAGIAGGLRVHLARALDHGLDWGPCHGDFDAKNIHVAGGALTVIDFDLCGPGWRAYDLAPAYRAAREAGEPEPWEAFVRGYTDERPLSSADLAAVPAFRLLRQLELLGIFASNTNRWGVLVLPDDRLDRWLSALRKLAVEIGLGTSAQRHIVRAPPDAGPAERRRRITPTPLVDVGYSLLDERALSDEIARSYAIETPVTCRLLHWGLNDTYLVPGPRERHVARLHRAGAASAAEIGYELELLAHLSEAGVSVARPIPTGDGRPTLSLVAPEGPRELVLFAHAAGSALTWRRPVHGHLLGGLAARIHAATTGYSPRTPRRPLDLEHLVTRPLAALRPFLERRGSDWRCLRRVADELGERTEAAARAGLDWGVCHGDLRPGCVYLDEQAGATVLGFDRCGPGWRVYDFAMIQWGSMGRDDDAYWRSFLAGYAEVRPLGPLEIEAIPVVYALRQLSALGQRAENAAEWGTRQVSEEILDEELAFFRAWEARHSGGPMARRRDPIVAPALAREWHRERRDAR